MARHGHLRPDVGHEVEAVPFGECIQTTTGERPDPGLDGRHSPGREDAAQEPSVQVVIWGVLEDEHAGGQLDVRLDDLEDRPLGRAIGRPVEETAFDVVVAAEGEEVVLLVVVEGRLVAHPLPDRVRIGVDVEVIGVVVDIRRHWPEPSRFVDKR